MELWVLSKLNTQFRQPVYFYFVMVLHPVAARINDHLWRSHKGKAL